MATLSKIILVLILFLIPFQDMLDAFLFKIGLPNSIIFFFGILKEILICFLGFCLIIYNKGKMPRKLTLFYVIIIYVFFLFTTGAGPFDMKIAGLRQYLLLFISVLAGYFVTLETWKNIILSKSFAIVLGCFVVFCFLQFFVLPLSIFKDYFPILEMKRVALHLESSNEYFDTGLPVNYMGEAGPRMLGPFNEPLYTAYFALPFFNYNLWMYLEKKEKNRLLLTVLFFLVIMLSQTRAVILMALLYLILCLRNKFNFRIVLYVLFGAGLVLFFKRDWIDSLVLSLLTSEGRSADHFLAYAVGIKLILENFWGTGLGSGSAISTFLGGNNIVSLSVENAFINTALDLGVIITVVFLLTLLMSYFTGEKKRKSFNLKTPSPYNIIILQFVCMGFLAPHILTIRVIIPYMFIIGVAIKEAFNEGLYYNYNYHG